MAVIKGLGSGSGLGLGLGIGRQHKAADWRMLSANGWQYTLIYGLGTLTG